MFRITEVIKNIIIINAIVFLAQMVLGDYFDMRMGFSHFPLSEDFRPFQIVTSMFMHADVQHLFFNMLLLFFLGSTVEDTLGGKRFFTLYIAAGLVGTLLHVGVDYYEYFRLINKVDYDTLQMIMNEGNDILKSGKNYTNPTHGSLNAVVNGAALGASGAVYGVVIAFVTMFPMRKLTLFPIPIQIPAIFLGIMMVGYGVFSGIGQLTPGIAHFAHLGGALMGFLMIHNWKMANLG